MKNGPWEDVFPIENKDIPASYVRLLGRVHPRKLTAGQQKPSPGAFPQDIPIFRDQKIRN